jgi:hypothetical protein
MDENTTSGVEIKLAPDKYNYDPNQPVMGTISVN